MAIDTDIVTIFQVPLHDDNDDAHESLRSLGEPFQTVVCPQSVTDLYRMPFVSDPETGRHFGLDGIRRFVETKKRKAAAAGDLTMAAARRRTDDNLRRAFG